MSEDFGWHIWVIKPNKFTYVEKYLNSLGVIKEILYPTKTSEFKLRNNTKKKKRTPLYSGYLFLRYEDSPELYYKISAYPFITTYVGKCSGKDLEKVREVKVLEELNVINKKFELDDNVCVNSGPLKGFIGSVEGVNSSSIVILTEVFGRVTRLTVDKDDADILKRS